MTWYAVAYRSVNSDFDEPLRDEKVWTISENPNEPGWETDCGYPGYGLTRDKAEHLALAANAYEAALAMMRRIPGTYEVTGDKEG